MSDKSVKWELPDLFSYAPASKKAEVPEEFVRTQRRSSLPPEPEEPEEDDWDQKATLVRKRVSDSCAPMVLPQMTVPRRPTRKERVADEARVAPGTHVASPARALAIVAVSWAAGFAAIAGSLSDPGVPDIPRAAAADAIAEVASTADGLHQAQLALTVEKAEPAAPAVPTDGRVALTLAWPGVAGQLTLTPKGGPVEVIGGPFPKVLRLEPGSYRVSAFRPGSPTFRQDLDLGLDEPERHVSVRFKKPTR